MFKKELEENQLDELRRGYQILVKLAREELARGQTDTDTPEA